MSRNGWAAGQLGHDTEHDELHDEIVQLGLIVVNVRSASYTAVLSDAGKLVEFTMSTAGVFTIPTAASQPFAVGTVMGGCQYGAGTITVAGQSGVVIRSAGNAYRTTMQYAEFSVRKRATNEWLLSGNVMV